MQEFCERGIDAIKCKACTLCLVCDIVGHDCAIGNVTCKPRRMIYVTCSVDPFS